MPLSDARRGAGTARPVVGLTLALLLLASVARAETIQTLRNVKIGEQIPDFSVRGLDGRTLTKAGYRGKVLLLIFARPEQAKSLTAIKTAERVFQAHPASKLAVLAVSTKEAGKAYFTRIAEEFNVSYPIGLDPKRKMYGDFGLIVAPTTLLIDESGTLRFELPHIPPRYDRKLRLHTDLMLGKITKAGHDAALAGRDEAARADDAPVERRLALARKLIDRGDITMAIPLLTKLRSEHPDSAAVAAMLGACYLAVNKVNQAAECLDPWANRRPVPSRMLLPLARLEVRRTNDAKAESYLNAALETSPDRGPVLFELGRLHERRGDLKKAVQYYRRALERLYGQGV